MPIKFEHVVVHRLDGQLAVLHIIVEAPIEAFSPDVAIENGFVVEERDGVEVWAGGITDWGIERELARSAVAFSTWRRIDPAQMPASRDFRGAWSDLDGEIAVDMVAAREIQRERLRLHRKPLLEDLDVHQLRALEKGDVKAQRAIAVRKQALRDITDSPTIEAATTPGELALAGLDQV